MEWLWCSKQSTQKIAIATCRQVAYDRGFTNNLASSQVSAWNRKIYEIIQSGRSFDQESNPLSSDHFGTVKYTDIIEQQYPTYIREMFWFVQRVNRAQSNIRIIYRKFLIFNLYVKFHKHHIQFV